MKQLQSEILPDLMNHDMDLKVLRNLCSQGKQDDKTYTLQYLFKYANNIILLSRLSQINLQISQSRTYGHKHDNLQMHFTDSIENF